MKLQINCSIIAILICLILLGGCASQRTMQIVEKSLEEGKILIDVDLNKYDILKEYSHLLPPPQQDYLSLHLSNDHSYFPQEGGKTILQIGLASKNVEIAKSHLHVLVVQPKKPEEGKKEVAVLIKSMDQYKLPKGSTITVDFMRSQKANISQATLLDYEKTANMEDFLRRFLLYPFQSGKHHLILAIGEHGDLSRKEQQNVVDMATFLSSRGVSISVIAFGDSPDFAFLAKVAQSGEGLFNVITPDFDPSKWLSQEIHNMHAMKLNDIEIIMQLGKSVSLTNKMFNFPHTFKKDKFRTPELEEFCLIPIRNST